MSARQWVRALHAIEPLPAGGAESVVAALVTESLRRTVPVAVAALRQSPEPSPFVEGLRARNVEVQEVSCGRRRYLAEIRALADTIRSVRAQVVHTHVYHADLVGYRAARISGRPVVATVHGFTGGGWKGRFYEWLDRKVLGQFDAVLCVSDSVRARVLESGCDPRRLHVVPNAYAGEEPLSRSEARAALGVAGSDRVIGWVGRLSREKGADLLIEAAAALPPDVVVIVVGDGPERPRLEALTPPGGRVRFAGARLSAGRLLRAFDALAISSRTEGLPMVLLEAMAAEVPVVSFAVGGVPDVVGADSAWLVPPGGTGALARALGEALSAPDEVLRRVARAREVLDERFGAARWFDQIQAIYGEVVKRAADSRA